MFIENIVLERPRQTQPNFCGFENFSTIPCMGLIGDLTGHKSGLEGLSLSRLCRLSQASLRVQWICPVMKCLSSPKRLELWGRGDVRDADWRPQSCGPFEEHPVAPAQVGLLWLGTAHRAPPRNCAEHSSFLFPVSRNQRSMRVQLC